MFAEDDDDEGEKENKVEEEEEEEGEGEEENVSPGQHVLQIVSPAADLLQL